MFGLAHRGFSLADYDQHIVNVLRPHGYMSALFGIQHVAPDADQIGYDHVWEGPSRKVKDVVPAVVEWLDNGPEEPFFLSVGFIETHRIGEDYQFYEPGPDEDARYTLPPAPLPDADPVRRDMAEFKAMAKVYDEGVGAVLDALERNGLAENTLVINTTDHGIAFPHMKCHLTDHGLGVMLIMRGPGGFEGGKVIDSMVSHIDIFPTICELLEIEPPDWLQGRSVLPLVRGEADAINEEIYGEVTYHGAYEPKRCVRTDRYKYIRRFDERDTPGLLNTDRGYSKSYLLEHGADDLHAAEEQLYDLIFDPNEQNNLAYDTHLRDLLYEMRERLEAWMARTGDPLLEGHIPAPDPEMIRDPDGKFAEFFG
jgi:arylsulfatase A-like enzyme